MLFRLVGACVCIIVCFRWCDVVIYQSKANLSHACHFEPFPRDLWYFRVFCPAWGIIGVQIRLRLEVVNICGFVCSGLFPGDSEQTESV